MSKMSWVSVLKMDPVNILFKKLLHKAIPEGWSVDVLKYGERKFPLGRPWHSSVSSHVGFFVEKAEEDWAERADKPRDASLRTTEKYKENYENDPDSWVFYAPEHAPKHYVDVHFELNAKGDKASIKYIRGMDGMYITLSQWGSE